MTDSLRIASRLDDPQCLQFPFQVTAQGPRNAGRARHVRDLIEQVLFTAPGERVFRPDFGGGARTLVFEPNASPLWAVVEQRLRASLVEALRGEVDPASLEVRVVGEEERLEIAVRYRLAAIGVTEEHRF